MTRADLIYSDEQRPSSGPWSLEIVVKNTPVHSIIIEKASFWELKIIIKDHS